MSDNKRRENKKSTTKTINEIAPLWAKKLKDRDLSSELVVGKKRNGEGDIRLLRLSHWAHCVLGEAHGFGKKDYVHVSSKHYCEECDSIGFEYAKLHDIPMSVSKIKEYDKELKKINNRLEKHWNSVHEK